MFFIRRDIVIEAYLLMLSEATAKGIISWDLNGTAYVASYYKGVLNISVSIKVVEEPSSSHSADDDFTSYVDKMLVSIDSVVKGGEVTHKYYTAEYFKGFTEFHSLMQESADASEIRYFEELTLQL